MKVSLITAREVQANQARRSSRPNGGVGQVYDRPWRDIDGSPSSFLHVEKRSFCGRQFLPATISPAIHSRKGAHDDARRSAPASAHKDVEILPTAGKLRTQTNSSNLGGKPHSQNDAMPDIGRSAPDAPSTRAGVDVAENCVVKFKCRPASILCWQAMFAARSESAMNTMALTDETALATTQSRIRSVFSTSLPQSSAFTINEPRCIPLRFSSQSWDRHRRSFLHEFLLSYDDVIGWVQDKSSAAFHFSGQWQGRLSRRWKRFA